MSRVSISVLCCVVHGLVTEGFVMVGHGTRKHDEEWKWTLCDLGLLAVEYCHGGY